MVRERSQAIRQCTDEGLQAIVDGYMQVNTICLPAGHYRVEEGSEHFLFYELEERLCRPFIHGNIVALGVFVMSRLQNNQHVETVRFMDELGLDYRPTSLGIRREDLKESLLNLHDFVEAKGHWYTIINERTIERAWVEELCNDLYESRSG